MSDHDVPERLRSSTDAHAWAVEWAAANAQQPMGARAVLGWFDGAIEAGRAAGRAEARAELAEPATAALPIGTIVDIQLGLDREVMVKQGEGVWQRPGAETCFDDAFVDGQGWVVLYEPGQEFFTKNGKSAAGDYYGGPNDPFADKVVEVDDQAVDPEDGMTDAEALEKFDAALRPARRIYNQVDAALRPARTVNAMFDGLVSTPESKAAQERISALVAEAVRRQRCYELGIPPN